MAYVKNSHLERSHATLRTASMSQGSHSTLSDEASVSGRRDEDNSMNRLNP